MFACFKKQFLISAVSNGNSIQNVIASGDQKCPDEYTSTQVIQ